MYWNSELVPDRLIIEVEDSGLGYSTEEKNANVTRNYSGRGIELIKRLSESVEVYPPGNKIRVIVK